ncbi:MAG: hypothetical protein Q8P18_34440 [Pseudomonadota bacterium]|nr:hypothetical protein [Pseudomonadota bacterium]
MLLTLTLTTLGCSPATTDTSAPPPVPPPGGTGWAALSHDGYAACALDGDGSVHCWGNDDARVVTDAPAGTGFRAISVDQAACALDAEGALTCWGTNLSGNLTDLPSGSFVAVSLGGGLGCAVDAGGHPVCWGASAWTLADRLALVVTALDVEASLVCGLDATGALACDGTFGDGDDNFTPLEGSYSEVSAGGSRGCALDHEGRATCFNDRWSSDDYEIPGTGLHGLVSGRAFSCALDAHHLVVCAGPRSAQEVTPGIPDRPLARLVAGGDVVCGLDDVGAITCWGESTSNITDGPAADGG